MQLLRPNSWRRRSRSALSCWLLLLSAAPAGAALKPGLNIPALVEQSDVIAVGTVSIVREGEPTSIVTPSGEIVGRMVTCELRVDQVLKGPRALTQLRFQFIRPGTGVTLAYSNGYQSVPSGTTLVLLLKKHGNAYGPTSPYYPSLVSTVGAPIAPAEPLEAVLAAIVRVLQAPAASNADKYAAIWALYGVKNSVSIGGLRSMLDAPDPDLRLTAAAALLAADDAAALAVAEPALMEPEPGLGRDTLPNLRGALGNSIKTTEAIPSLVRLLGAPDVETRRAAADALRHTNADAAIPGLVRALDDADGRVQYSSVMGLAEITGQMTGATATAMRSFLQNPEPYVAFWKEWARRR